MKRWIINLGIVAGLGLYAGMVSADPGGYVPPGGPNAGVGNVGSFAQIAGPNTLLGCGDLPPGRGPDKYGFHPCLKKFFHIPNTYAARGPGYYGPGNPLANPANWAAGGYGQGGPAFNPNGFPPGAYGPSPGAYGPAGMPGGMAGPGCAGPGCAGPGGMGGAGPYAAGCYGGNPQLMMQGTLVFPYNNLIRSPRDYFMMDLNK